jgi:hypothetical protein
MTPRRSIRAIAEFTNGSGAAFRDLSRHQFVGLLITAEGYQGG